MRFTRHAARRIARIQDKSRQKQCYCAHHDCLGWIHLRAGDAQEGSAELEKALVHGVDGVAGYGGVYYRLARAYLARAQVEPGARAHWVGKVRDCCANARATDLRGEYEPLIADLLIQADALTGQKTGQPSAPVQKAGA